MVQLRTAAHTLAELDLPPGEILRKLDRMAASLPGAPFATCVAAVVETVGGNCVIAAAGHPPPAVAGPDGPARLLELPAGLPLGLGTGSVETTEVGLPPGAVLALYTDGLVETRARSLEDGITALRDALSRALARPDGTLDSCCENITQVLGPHGEDDVTLVLAASSPDGARDGRLPVAALGRRPARSSPCWRRAVTDRHMRPPGTLGLPPSAI